MRIDQAAEQIAQGRPEGAGSVSGQAGPTVARMLLGGRLRRLREARGITRGEAGEAIRASHSKISRLELGRTGFKRRDVADLLTLYGVRDQIERARWLALAAQAKVPGWVHNYSDVVPSWVETALELEQATSVIRCYAVHFVPDLLQTRDYARAVNQLNHPFAAEREVDRRISLLIKRQALLHRTDRPGRLWVILDEAVLRRRVGDATTMRRQLEHLIEITELPQVTVQVVPFCSGGAAAGAITLLRFCEPELADVVYLEQLTSALFLDKPADVDHYVQVLDRLCAQAETPGATPGILQQILKETSVA